MENCLVTKGVNLKDFMLVIDQKSWKKLGLNVETSLSPEEKSILIKTVNTFDPFFEGKVRDNQVLVYIPRLEEGGAFSLRWWQERLLSFNLPLKVQLTDIYDIRFFLSEFQVSPGWYLFTKKMLYGSKFNSWSEQEKSLKYNYRAPSANELLTFLIMTYLNGIILPDNDLFGRTMVNKYNISSLVGRILNKKINVICEVDVQEKKEIVGMYACKKII